MMQLPEFLAQIHFVATPNAEIIISIEGQEFEVDYIERAVTPKNAHETTAPIRIVLRT